MDKTISIEFTGKVQQVGFRYFVFRLASELGIKGYVRNQPDGSVYIEAESDSNHLTVFVEHCKKGPPQSKIHHFRINEIPKKNFDDFKIY